MLIMRVIVACLAIMALQQVDAAVFRLVCEGVNLLQYGVNHTYCNGRQCVVRSPDFPRQGQFIVFLLVHDFFPQLAASVILSGHKQDFVYLFVAAFLLRFTFTMYFGMRMRCKQPFSNRCFD